MTSVRLMILVAVVLTGLAACANMQEFSDNCASPLAAQYTKQCNNYIK